MTWKINREWVYCRDRMPPNPCPVFAAVRSLVDDREPWIVEVFYSRISGKDYWGYGYDAIPMIESGEAEVYAWMERWFPEPPVLPDGKGDEND